MARDRSATREAATVRGPRSAGVLAHVTSIPGGTLGDARRFVDWLATAGVGWWQVLPVGPPDEHGSPYRSASAFAGWSGLLASPRARVTVADEDDFRLGPGAGWIDEWVAFVTATGGDAREAVRDQVRFEREWRALRAHAADAGVRLIGDVPIYVAPDGADHRAHPQLFRAGAVAGVPPDAFSATGQRWGNPLFDWPAHRRQGYRWWTERLRRTFDLVDLTRIDHFRAFTAYWAVPEECPTAIEGRWVRGPGRDVFDAAAAELGPLPVIAEDLGVITPAVERLRDELGFPGMAVLQFGFDGTRPNLHHPSRHHEHQVAYSGTHDNDTALGWWRSLAPAAQGRVRATADAAGVEADSAQPWWTVVDLTMASPAAMAIVPLQDVLGLGSDARMNQPGTAVGNWSWQAERRQLTPAVAGRLRRSLEGSDRLAP
ncbi:4-alpha-glucanotransferase [Iamia sp. SCSIO 61187]|nr:4-alpha-glucanotransferase [Iamia sp. SCSIO 61187]